MKKIIRGIIASEPYIREVKNGVLTHFIIWSKNEPNHYVSTLCRENLAVSVGDIADVRGHMREREYYDGSKYQTVTELVAEQVKW